MCMCIGLILMLCHLKSFQQKCSSRKRNRMAGNYSGETTLPLFAENSLLKEYSVLEFYAHLKHNA